MNKYGKVALKAVAYCKKGHAPVMAWEKAALEVFGNSISAIKSCPKSTFLGLCEAGLINEIPVGKYTRSKKNKNYALNAIEVLKLNANKHYSPKELWSKIQIKPIRHNSQMDVVLELWKNKLLV